MKWINFARLNQAIEYQTPTRTISIIKKDWEEFDKETLIKILSLELNSNNLKSKKALRWITNAMEVFEDEIEMEIYTYGDIGEALYHFDENETDSNFGIKTILDLLTMDCSRIDGDSYRKFRPVFLQMSSLERKWFIRYWLRTPRNGVNKGTVRKLLANIYDKTESQIKKDTQLHSMTSLYTYYDNGEIPPNNLIIGRYVSPMLAKTYPRERWPKSFIMEYKYDGARYQIHRGREVIIFNRKGMVVTHQFPEIAETVKNWDNLPNNFIIDTEIYPIDSEGFPAPFKNMGTRIHMKDIEATVEKCPVNLAVFDCMMYDVENLLDLTLAERLSYIEKFPNQAKRNKVITEQDSFYNLAINDNYEGIMIKSLDSKYEAGKRSIGWIKYKPPRFELDVVVIGGRYGDGKRSSVFSSYDVAVKSGSNFLPVGSVGTGFSDSDLFLLTQKFKTIVSTVNNGTYTFLPRVVFEVTCDLVTQDTDDNYGLRFPRLVRIRDDKPVSDITTLIEMEEMI